MPATDNGHDPYGHPEMKWSKELVNERMAYNVFIPYFEKDAIDVFGIEMDTILKASYPTMVTAVKRIGDPIQKKVIKIFFTDNPHKRKLAKKYFYNELNILKRVNHPHIMCIDTAASFPLYLCIVMPFYEAGTLSDALQEIGHDLIDRYLVQLCSAVKYLHERSIVHRDIKTDNILITNGNDVVLTDFGFSTILVPGQTHVTNKKGTVVFTSPEQDREISYDGFKADMYSFGVVLWCMYFKQDVIKVRPTEPLLHKVRKTKLLPYLDRTILAGLLDENPLQRWSINQLIESMTGSERFVHRLARLESESQ